MAINTTSRSYRPNLRSLRRYIVGRGLNLRQTIVDGVVYAEERISVPGLHAEDAIVGLLNLTDLVDAAGYLDVVGDKASLDVFSGNKGVTFTARSGGADGNLVYVKAAADPSVSAPLSVTVGAYDAVLGTTGHPGKTAILVNLATDEAGAALTSDVNSAANVRVVVLDDPAAAAVVDAVLDGSGATAWTATGPTAMSGGADFSQGPVRAELVTDGPYDEDDIRYVAAAAGLAGNSITVAHTAGGSLGVSVTGPAVTVTFVAGTTTAKAAAAAVNAHAGASALVVANPAPGNPDGSGLLTTMGATNLSGGVDPGIRLTVASGSTKLMLTWLTRDES